jgi:hypothetical protein
MATIISIERRTAQPAKPQPVDSARKYSGIHMASQIRLVIMGQFRRGRTVRQISKATGFTGNLVNSAILSDLDERLKVVEINAARRIA